MLYNMVCEGLKSKGFVPEALKSYSPTVRHAIGYINENLNAGLKISDIAKHLYLSEGYISKLFRQETGYSLKKYINDKLLNEAALALRHTSMNIKEISASLGFCDQFYFSRVFSSHYGMSPKNYRRLIIV